MKNINLNNYTIDELKVLLSAIDAEIDNRKNDAEKEKFKKIIDFIEKEFEGEDSWMLNTIVIQDTAYRNDYEEDYFKLSWKDLIFSLKDKYNDFC